MFAHLQPYAGDPIFALGDACNRDPRADKVNLTVGMYYDEDGRIPLLESVRAAETRLAQEALARVYLPMEGHVAYRQAVQQLVFGADSAALRDGRVATIQGVGGTGALKVGAEFLHDAYPDSEVWISDPAWSNHFAVFEGSGIRTHRYPYYDAQTHRLTLDAMLDTLEGLPAHSIVLLHACCHNPSGADLSHAQWQAVAAVLARRQLIAFLDLAYQGFGSGLDEDAWVVRMLAQSGRAFLVANSFSRNFSFYAERCGALSVVCEQATHTGPVTGQLIAAIRRTYSNPPLHGARVIAHILGDPGRAAQWHAEVAAMRTRIRAMRELAHARLAQKAPAYDAGYLLAQHGMFSLTGLSLPRIHALRERHAVYMLESGRICLPGLNLHNIEHFTDAMAAVVSDPSLEG